MTTGNFFKALDAQGRAVGDDGRLYAIAASMGRGAVLVVRDHAGREVKRKECEGKRHALALACKMAGGAK